MRVSWAELYEQVGECRKCRLCESRRHVVPGEGDPNANLMFIGEGPGQEEDRLGRPFVGRSGELLTRMIHAIGIERAETYICNVVKCRPPGNRNPEPDEAGACLGYLRAQVALVRPKVIVLLGKVACRYTINEEIFITRDHGRWFERKGTCGFCRRSIPRRCCATRRRSATRGRISRRFATSSGRSESGRRAGQLDAAARGGRNGMEKFRAELQPADRRPVRGREEGAGVRRGLAPARA